MALGCDPCNCTGMLDTETYRVNVIRLLCAMNEKLDSGGSVTIPMIDTLDDDSVVQFLRVYMLARQGTILGYEDRELDGTTGYTVQGTVSFY